MSEYRQTIETPSDRVIVALDNMPWDEASDILADVGPHVGMGKANAIAQIDGWRHAVQSIGAYDLQTMADPKFHDIPETVGLEVEAVTSVGARFITVHASSGQKALEYAVAGRNRAFDKQKSGAFYDDLIGGILGITVLTSHDEAECISIYGDNPERKVVEFARIALASGIDGIVCSGKELRAIRGISELDGLVTVVPGITPTWAKKAGDQKRVVTPSEAVQEGADFIVVGRAITQPPGGISRLEAAQRIEQELKEAA